MHIFCDAFFQASYFVPLPQSGAQEFMKQKKDRSMLQKDPKDSYKLNNQTIRKI